LSAAESHDWRDPRGSLHWRVSPLIDGGATVRALSLRSILALLPLSAAFGCGYASKDAEVAAAQVASDAVEHDAMLPFPVHTKTLANGLEVIVVKTTFPNLVSLQIPVKTGSRNEVEPGKTGFAHFFEHMMFRGTAKYPPDAYQEIVNRAGARQNAYTTDDFTNYHITFAKEDLDAILEIEADRFQNLEYPLAAFQTEARAVLGEYNKNFANPISKLFEVQRDAAYTTHTYKHTTMGFIRDIEAMPEQFEYSRTFFDRWYRPEYATVVLVGDLDPQEVFAKVERHFGPWERGDFTLEIPQEPRHDAPVVVHHEWPSPTLPLLSVAFRGPAFSETDLDSAAMELLLALWFGETSDLYRELVQVDQKVDLFFAGNADNEDPDLIQLLARVKDPADLPHVRDRLLATAARARLEAVDPGKLEEAKSFLRYSFAAGLTSNEAIGAVLARFVRHRRSVATLENLFRLYERVGPEDVRRAANTYFRDGGLVVTTIGSEPLPAKMAELPSLESLASAKSGATPAPRAEPAAADLVPAAALPQSAPVFPADHVLELKNANTQIVFRFLFEVGSQDDPQGKEGLAELTARMISDGGSRRREYSEIQRRLYPIAGSFGSQVDRELTVFGGAIHRDNLATFADVALDQLLDPGFRDDDFRRIVENQRNALLVDLRSNNDEELGKERLLGNVFTGSGYAHPTAGTEAGLAAITLDDVRAFYRENLTQGRLLLGVSGDVPAEFLLDLRRRIAASLAASGPLDRQRAPGQPARPKGLAIDIVEKETRATAISLGHPIEVTRAHPDYAALYLARTFLGEHRSSLSWLYQRLRELRGMNYGDYAYIEAFPRGGSRFFPDPNVARRSQIFEVWIRPVPPEQAHFALRATLYELERLIENGLTAEQFETTREYLMKNVYLLVDGQSRELGYRLDSRFYGISEYATFMREKLAALTLDEVNSAVRRHLSAKDLHVVFVTKDATSLREQLLADDFSAMTYNSEKPAELLAEDRIIGAMKLALRPEQVRITPVADVFAR
jgi:zinc protease